MSLIAVGILGAAAVGYAGYAASKSQKDAAARAAVAQGDATTANLDMYHQSRGSEGSAIFPEYGTEEEKAAWLRASQIFAATSRGLGTPEEQYVRAQSDLAGYLPTFDAGTGLLADVYNGGVTDRQLAAAKPVAAARTALAAGQKTSLLQAAQETVNRINAQQPGSFGTFAQKMQMNALAPGLQAAANSEGQAMLLNAQEQQAILNLRDTMGLQYLNAPLERARQQVALRLMPTEALAQAYGSQLSPFSPFNVGVGKPPAITPLPTAGPIPGIGQIVASGVGQLANTAGNYYANQQYANQLNDIYARQSFNNQMIANPNYGGTSYLRANSVNPNAFPGTYQMAPVNTFGDPGTSGAMAGYA